MAGVIVEFQTIRNGDYLSGDFGLFLKLRLYDRLKGGAKRFLEGFSPDPAKKKQRSDLRDASPSTMR
jgi:hypothetical protein